MYLSAVFQLNSIITVAIRCDFSKKCLTFIYSFKSTWFFTRVTRCLCEKIAQKAQDTTLVEFNTKLFLYVPTYIIHM
jgi:hypothetical protein